MLRKKIGILISVGFKSSAYLVNPTQQNINFSCWGLKRQNKENINCYSNVKNEQHNLHDICNPTQPCHHQIKVPMIMTSSYQSTTLKMDALLEY
jgi:hypothetical protein